MGKLEQKLDAELAMIAVYRRRGTCEPDQAARMEHMAKRRYVLAREERSSRLFRGLMVFGIIALVLVVDQIAR